MLIQALCEYSDMLEGRGENKLPGYCSQLNVHRMIYLRPDGAISGIADIRNKKDVPQKSGKVKQVAEPASVILPKRSQKTGIDVNIAEHRPLYIFGLNYENGAFTPEDKTDKAKKSHECCVKGNLEFCEGLDSEIVNAYRNFLACWKPEEQTENPLLLALGKDYASSYYCFALDGHPEITLHEDAALMEKYAAEHPQETTPSDDTDVMCAITGQRLPVARIHEKIKGIRNGNPVGSVLVGVKESAYESYGKTQAYNSNISEQAMRKYTAALNRLLADRKHRIFIEDTTILFFAMTQDDGDACDLFKLAMDGNPDEAENDRLASIAAEMTRGRAGNTAALHTDEDVLFYVAGFTPNSSRISQKFLLRDKFGVIMDHIEQHQRDLQVRADGRQMALSWLMKELVSPKSSNQTVPAPLTAAMFYAILNGTRYPEQLLSTVIRRVKTDSDEEKNRFIKLNDTRIGIIKACLNRKARLAKQEEEIKMALDTESKNAAYVCGRLFALLEYIQQGAANGTLNRTIKDSFFASACTKPATVFPRLLRLSQNHMGKLDNPGYWNKRIGEIVTLIENDFPQTLSLNEQGKFIIGYYHQNNALYTKKPATNQVNGKDE